MDDVLTVPQGEFTLHRDHHDPDGPLRAWDAADEYVLDHVATERVEGDRWLVVNDSFGALTTALAARAPQTWSDSLVALTATGDNLARNGFPTGTVTPVHSTEDPTGPVDVAVVKIPRTLAFLDDQLRRLRPLLHPDSVVIGAGMTKAVHNSTIEAFERSIGPTPTTRARKKARLLLATVDPTVVAPAPLEPSTWDTEAGVTVVNLPNVFSSHGLDLGTRLLLDHLPAPVEGDTVVDLGCGNGVVGATLARRHPGIRLTCCDESFQAVDSARATVGDLAPDAEFHVTDVLDDVADASADVVVINPPFHAMGARTTDVAHRMFSEARRVLRSGGEVRVVGNRHLDHHVRLRQLFGEVSTLSSHPRFVVLSARKP